MPKEGTELGVDLGLTELVQVPEEFQYMSPTAAGERERWAVVPEVLSKRVPVAALLVLIAAEGGGGRG